MILAVVTAGCIQGPVPEVPKPTATPGEPAEPVRTVPPGAWVAAGNLTIEVLDVGQADAIVIHEPDATVLVDTGDRFRASYGAVLDHLRADGVDVVDAVVITHPDADHAGGCEEVLAQVEVAQVIHPGLSKDTATWQNCLQAIRAEGAPVLTDTELDPGDTVPLGSNATATVLWLDEDAADPNEGSVVLRLDHGNASALLTGDIGCSTEDAILRTGLDLDVDLLKVAHHGSGGSTCRDWLAATTPTLGIVSVGADNRYGHPDPGVLERLAAAGAQVFRTDEAGTVAATTNGTAWAVLGAPEASGATGDGTGHADGNATQAPPGLELVEVHADAPGDDRETLDQEWVRILNPTNATVDLSGWTLTDEADHTYPFPHSTTLRANGTLTVHTGHGRDNATDLFWDREQPVWNNDGDTASLYAADGTLVDARTYP